MGLESFLINDLSATLLSEIEEFLDSQTMGHVFQFPQWADPGSKIFILREEGKIRWASIFDFHLPFGSRVPWIRAATAVRGPVCDNRSLSAAVLEELIRPMADERLAYLEISPECVEEKREDSAQIAGESGWTCVGQGRASLRLGLVPSEEKIFADFRKTSRYDVRHAERAGVTVSAESQEAYIDEFLRLYQDLGARKGFAAEGPGRMRRQIRWLVNGHSRGALLVAQKDATICGGAVIGRSGKRCFYIWGATDRAQKVNVGQILQWRAIQWAKSHGCLEYDFGGYTPDATSGPAWFKAGFGGTAVHFPPMRRRIFATAKYRVYRMLNGLRSMAG